MHSRKITLGCISLLRAAAFRSPAFQRQHHVRQVHLTSVAAPAVFSSSGDYAGYHVTYDIDGTHIPIPVHYVPEALLEWGQVPAALEVIVSETAHDTDTDGTTERHILTVLPEIGCGNDNLEVLQRREVLGTPLWQSNDGCVYVSHFTKDTTRMECIFNQHDDNSRRSRVVLQCDTGMNLRKPVSLYIERKFSDTSTQGRRADGGGLDARSVAEWIGPELRSQQNSFLNRSSSHTGCPPLPLESINNTTTAFGLPENITVAYNNKSEKGCLLTIWMGQAYDQQNRWIEMQYWDESKWTVRSWMEGNSE